MMITMLMARRTEYAVHAARDLHFLHRKKRTDINFLNTIIELDSFYLTQKAKPNSVCVLGQHPQFTATLYFHIDFRTLITAAIVSCCPSLSRTTRRGT